MNFLSFVKSNAREFINLNLPMAQLGKSRKSNLSSPPRTLFYISTFFRYFCTTLVTDKRGSYTKGIYGVITLNMFSMEYSFPRNSLTAAHTQPRHAVRVIWQWK